MKILQIFPIGFVSMFYQYNLKMILFAVYDIFHKIIEQSKCLD